MNIGYPGKRLFDLAVAVPALIVFSPLMAILAWIIKRRLGTPIFFRQCRPGLDERPFTILKFRTMVEGFDERGVPLPDEDRLTPLGRFLRATSVDEFPELVNVVRGEMSLVGPRPLLMEYQPYYTERERTRFRMRPGITGWAQVNGRNTLGWDERLEHDAWYMEHCTFALDVKILVITTVRVIRRENVVPDRSNLAQERRAATEAESGIADA